MILIRTFGQAGSAVRPGDLLGPGDLDRLTVSAHVLDAGLLRLGDAPQVVLLAPWSCNTRYTGIGTRLGAFALYA